MIGIYRIRNIVNNNCYYGSAKNIKRRWSKHKSQLKYNRHENIILQRAWNKYGSGKFVFEVIELCEEHELLVVEQKYLDLNPKYNIGKQASGGDNLNNHPNKDKIIGDMRISLNNKINSLNKEERSEKWGRFGNNNPNWKGGISTNHCVCGKKIAPEHQYCIKCLPRKGQNNPFFNKHHTDETKKRLSKMRKGKKPSNMITISIDNIKYESLASASKKLDIPIPTISWRLKSKNKKFDNYKYSWTKIRNQNSENQLKY
jgi:group I intron endonuclease